MFGATEKGNPLYLKRKAVIALTAAARIQPAQAESRIASNVNKQIKSVPEQPVLQFILAVIVTMPQIWPSCSRSAQDMLVEFVKNEKLSVFLKGLDGLKQISDLRSAFEVRIREMATDDLEQIVGVYQETPVITRCVDLFAQSPGWSVALGRYRRLISPVITRITKEHVLQILDVTSQRQNDLVGSDALNRFLQAVLEQGLFTREELSQVLASHGLADEMPDDENTTPAISEDIPF